MQETRLKAPLSRGCRIKLKDDVKWEELTAIGFEPRPTIPLPHLTMDYLIWYSYLDDCDAHGYWSCVEINKGSREIRNQGCLWLIYDLIAAGMVEVQHETGYITTWSKGVKDDIDYIQEEIEEHRGKAKEE